MIQKEIKTYKLTFNVISSPVNASFIFSRVLNLDFFCKLEDSVTKKYISPAKMSNKTNAARNITSLDSKVAVTGVVGITWLKELHRGHVLSVKVVSSLGALIKY